MEKEEYKDDLRNRFLEVIDTKDSNKIEEFFRDTAEELAANHNIHINTSGNGLVFVDKSLEKFIWFIDLVYLRIDKYFEISYDDRIYKFNIKKAPRIGVSKNGSIVDGEYIILRKHVRHDIYVRNTET